MRIRAVELRVFQKGGTLRIGGNIRSTFGTREDDFKGKRTCSAGRIRVYGRWPEIVADDLTMSAPWNGLLLLTTKG
jgi:hypothetical protein